MLNYVISSPLSKNEIKINCRGHYIHYFEKYVDEINKNNHYDCQFWKIFSEWKLRKKKLIWDWPINNYSGLNISKCQGIILIFVKNDANISLQCLDNDKYALSHLYWKWIVYFNIQK